MSQVVLDRDRFALADSRTQTAADAACLAYCLDILALIL